MKTHIKQSDEYFPIPNSPTKKSIVIRDLRRKLKKHREMLFKYKNEIKNLKTNLSTFLTENQISSLKQKNKKGFQWSNDSTTNALKIKFTCQTSGYEELNLNYPLPSLRIEKKQKCSPFPPLK